MKKLLFALLFVPCLALSAPSDTTKVSKAVIMQSLALQYAQAEEEFNASLSSDQIRKQNRMTLIEGQMQGINAIMQDTLKVKK